MVFKKISPAINTYLHPKCILVRRNRNKIISSFEINIENTVFHRSAYSHPFMASKSRGYFASSPDFELRVKIPEKGS